MVLMEIRYFEFENWASNITSRSVHTGLSLAFAEQPLMTVSSRRLQGSALMNKGRTELLDPDRTHKTQEYRAQAGGVKVHWRKWGPMDFRDMDPVTSRQWKLKAMKPAREPSGLLLNSSPGRLSVRVIAPRAPLRADYRSLQTWRHIKKCVQSLPTKNASF